MVIDCRVVLANAVVSLPSFSLCLRSAWQGELSPTKDVILLCSVQRKLLDLRSSSTCSIYYCTWTVVRLLSICCTASGVWTLGSGERTVAAITNSAYSLSLLKRQTLLLLVDCGHPVSLANKGSSLVQRMPRMLAWRIDHEPEARGAREINNDSFHYHQRMVSWI